MLARDMDTQLQQLPTTMIVGLGKTGLSCADFLARRGVPFSVMDTRAEPPGLAELLARHGDVPCFTGGFDAAAMAAAEEIVVSPGIPVDIPELVQAERDGKRIIGDIELFARYVDAPVLAITGTNGKSTVTDLLGQMAAHCQLNVKVGGNIGTPVLDLLPRSAEEPRVDLYVLEISSFQLETTWSLNAAVAILLNISEDHMDRYSSISDYVNAKDRVFSGDGVMVLNLDDPLVAARRRVDRETVGFTLGNPGPGDFGLCEDADDVFLCMGDAALLNTDELQLRGKHNYANCLAALAVGHAWGLPMQAMLETLRNYRGLKHRMQYLGSYQGVDWFNDSKGTNVGATVAAVNGVDCRVVLIAGGDGKGADFSPLRSVVPRLRALVGIGRDGAKLAAVVAPGVQSVQAQDMAEAVRLAASLARSGDCILLSPACASFDMYRNYEERGEDFMRCFTALRGEQ